MYKRIKVLAIFGGKSAEYLVSLQSAYSIIKAIDKDKYEVITLGINEEGNFKLFNGDIDKIKNNTWEKESKEVTLSLSSHNQPYLQVNNSKINFDIAFPILHGTNGEDGTIQGMFELLGIKYVGCDMSASLLAMDKHIAKEIVNKEGIKVANGVLVNSNDDMTNIKERISNLKYPLFIKPLKAGSSFGISKIFSELDLQQALCIAFNYDKQVIIEETIEGFEVGCAIIGNEELVIGTVDEIEIQTDFFDYEEKYSLKTSKIHLPARLSVSELERIKDTALKIYQILRLKGLSRVDMFYTKNKEIIFNEVNTLPGFTDNSRFPNMLKAVGYTFDSVVNDLIALGLES